MRQRSITIAKCHPRLGRLIHIQITILLVVAGADNSVLPVRLQSNRRLQRSEIKKLGGVFVNRLANGLRGKVNLLQYLSRGHIEQLNRQRGASDFRLTQRRPQGGYIDGSIGRKKQPHTLPIITTRCRCSAYGRGIICQYRRPRSLVRRCCTHGGFPRLLSRL